MSHTRKALRNDRIPDDYPARPDSMLENEQDVSNTEKKETYTVILICLTFFLYGSGISIYGLLFPTESRRYGLESYIYGSVIATSHLIAVLFYPIACRMVTSVACRLSLSLGALVIGVCRVLFGLLALTSSETSFIALSFAIQAVEGMGISILLASTYVTMFSQNGGRTGKNTVGIHASLALGLTLGPICGEAVKQALGYSVPFYGIGGLTLIGMICVATMLPEPAERISFFELPIFSWVEEARMLIYFFIVFFTFNYTGFLSVTLESLLRQLHLKSLFIGMMFAIPAFMYGLTSPGWTWLTKKGFNSLMLVCFGSFFIIASLILIGPAPFTDLESSLSCVLAALLLNGLGTGAKVACVIYAADRDLKSQRTINTPRDELLIPTILAVGSLLGYSVGSLTGGFTYFYLGLERATFVLIGIEVITGVMAMIFAFKRNYRNPRYPGIANEQDPILGT